MIVADKTYKHEVDDKMSNLPFRQCLLKDLHLISDNVSTYIMIVYSINTTNISKKLHDDFWLCLFEYCCTIVL